MKMTFKKATLALIAVIVLPTGAQSQISAEGQDPLTDDHLRLVLGDSTSLTDLSLPDGEVLTERWYRGTDHKSFFGFFHVKLVVSPENDDELFAQHDFVLRDRGKILQGRLHTTCERDEFYTLQSIKVIGKRGEGKGRDYFNVSITFEPSAPDDSLPYVIKSSTYFRRMPKGCPENTLMLFLLAEKVRELPFDSDEVFTCNHFYPFEMEIGKNVTVRYVGTEEVKLDDRQELLHKFVCNGQGLNTIFLLVDDNHELIEITGAIKFEITLTSKQVVIDNWDF